MKILMVVNPRAAFGKGFAAVPEILRELEETSLEVVMLQAASLISLRAMAEQELTKNPDAVLAVGGDGMVHFAVNLLADTNIPFGVIPIGTGNDFATALEIPIRDVRAAVRQFVAALAKPAARFDAIKITKSDGNQILAASSFSGGFDALVNERANLIRFPKGKSRYDLAIMIELARLRPIKYRLTIDDAAAVELEAALITVANNSMMGGGMRIAPGADMRDGLLDLVLVDPLSRTKFLMIYPSVYKGNHIKNQRVHVAKIRKVRIEADAVVGFADGERIGNYPIELEVLPGALSVLY